MAEFSAQIFSTNFQRKFSAQIFSQIFSAALNANADSQCTNFNSNNLRVVSPLVYNIYSVSATHSFPQADNPTIPQLKEDSQGFHMTPIA